ncbi:hypothetical protein M1L60_26740 [Actinoplanes sp. TRM 88003]|uniref:Uncharacterized protein n=1 Tax=Paractinoplanes aksuensis TaxID=2939490 RepID=A0ABT1DTL7_9ACTN|nr:hypothetical protein [Actinoplanes aksuensis]MCO8274203.1 hypothetical protein [Actinoplanes aksuensis]
MHELKEFRRTCCLVAARTGGRVVEFRVADGVTPNFHQAIIDYRERLVAVVMARDTGVVALAVPRGVTGAVREAGPLTFVDFPKLTGALVDNGRFVVLTTDELAGPFKAAEWPALSSYDVQSWKPETLGETLYNYWD